MHIMRGIGAKTIRGEGRIVIIEVRHSKRLGAELRAGPLLQIRSTHI